jgi:N-acetyl-1-D-myo-inositol-2-amino-2-deoxy-alpha-D-glucopyranoside deacetylase
MTAPAKPGLMGIFAHPDDEAFGMAGTMARATRAGYPVAIVSATRGEEGQIADPKLATPENLGQVREQELRNACAAVGVTDVSFLDYIDGHLAEASPAEAVRKIVGHLRRFRPAVVATFDPKGGYGHVDHMAIHRLTLAAIPAAADPAYAPELGAPHRVRKVYYVAIPRERLMQMVAEARAKGEDFIPGGDEATIPVEEMGVPLADITTIIRLDDAEFAAKRQAMRAHATQMPADSPFVSAPPDQLRQFMGTETLQLVPPPVSDRAYPAPENDIFAGL